MRLVQTLIVVVALFATFDTANAAPPSGIWTAQTNDLRVEFKPCSSGAVCGYVAWMKGSGTGQAGKRMIFDVEQINDKKFKGTLVNPFDGKRYDGTIQMAGKNRMRLKGCVVNRRFACQSQIWRKTQ